MGTQSSPDRLTTNITAILQAIQLVRFERGHFWENRDFEDKGKPIKVGTNYTSILRQLISNSWTRT